ncbi:MAG: hypothetical protein BGN88_15750 [Clostridiales bacterium 43-6]|nr:MAG: hypothetical protein BGN88_15750 [Clostridiales bacterium 43-6]
MHVLAAQITLFAPFVHSLKEKRMILRSMEDRVKHKFNVSVAEVGKQDTHQIIVLGIACVSETAAQTETVISEVIRFIEGHTDADITDIAYCEI